jgi:transposase
LVKGAVNTEIFANFLVNAKFSTDNKHYLLLDNLPVHKTKKIREVAMQKNIELIFLVPYFPQLNPTEEIFNVIKEYVRKCKPRTEEELRKAIAEIVFKLNEEDLTKYFKDCLKFKIN